MERNNRSVRPFRSSFITASALIAIACIATSHAAGTLRNVEFARPDGVSLTFDADIPDGDGPFAAAILVHGGGFTKGDKTQYVVPLFAPLTAAKIVWISIDYRLAPAHLFPAAVEDVEAAIRYVRKNAADLKVDRGRLALIGESSGGYLVSFVGTRLRGSHDVALIVPMYAPHSLLYQAKQRKAMGSGLGGMFAHPIFDEAGQDLLKRAGADEHVRPGLPTFLLVHGTKDKKVDYEQSVQMLSRLKTAGVRAELLTIVGADHGMAGWAKHDSAWSGKLIAKMLALLPQ